MNRTIILIFLLVLTGCGDFDPTIDECVETKTTIYQGTEFRCNNCLNFQCSLEECTVTECVKWIDK